MIIRLIAVIILAFTAFNVNAQQLYFYLNDESMQIYSIDEVRRMDFDSMNIYIRLTDESVVSIELDALSKYQYYPEDITKIETIVERPTLSFYPNPADQQLNVRYSLPKVSSTIQVRIHNLKGEKLLEQSLKSSPTGELALDLTKLAAGQYFCTLTSGELVISKAFMKR
jgi:hypothetical protein